MCFGSDSGRAVAVVTGGSYWAGRDIARGLASWAWPIVVVYLDDQRRTEATIAKIINDGGTTVAVRADLADELDVHRLFGESIAAFGGVDVVVHTTTGNAAALYQHAARYIRTRGAIVSTSAAEPMPAEVGAQLRELGITVSRVPPDAVLASLDRWRQQKSE